MVAKLPFGFYSADPRERIAALRGPTLELLELRRQLLEGVNWPRYSPGTLNAWLVFLGASPGASPGKLPWDYDPRPAVGRAHPGVAEYQDAKGYWDGIRLFSRTILSDMTHSDAYMATMVRNLDDAQSAVGPRGSRMKQAARDVSDVLDRIVRPAMVVALGSVRTYTNQVFAEWPRARARNCGCLRTAKRGDSRPWFSLSGFWSTGEPFLYLAPSGIHPSLRHVSLEDTLMFLSQQVLIVRAGKSHHHGGG
jgi:hypothetical protein